VAFVSAALAFGRVASVLRSLERLLAILGPRPRTTVVEEDLRRLASRLRGFTHRWIRGVHVAEMLRALREGIRGHGSLGEAFPAGVGVEEGLRIFRERTLGRLRRPPARATRTLFAIPDGGSACKRTCMFLRWVARPADGLDLGLWSRPAPRDLVVPLDTHVVRIASRLGLTRRRTPGWAMAREITAGLREVDPEDPLRFDFPLAHLGMRGGCPPRLERRDCAACPLREGCPTGKRGLARRTTPP
jgi:uncharacterized protein (TIGR02757 family)